MMEIKYLPIDEVKPYENNPRINEDAIEPVAESIRRYGFKVPIVADKNGVILAGHTRLEAAKRLGLEKIPVIVAEDLTEEQAKAFRLADNKTAELAVWDFEKLEEELEALDFDAWIDSVFEKDMNRLDSVPKMKEIDLEEFGEEAFKYECEHCGFKFN